MSRTSCIVHEPRQAIAIIRADYYQLMERDTCAAALLNLFEYWANAALAADPNDERPWVGARPIREFEQMLLGISTDKQIRKRLSVLEARRFIQVQTPALRGAAKSYRVMIPEIQQALAGCLTDGRAMGCGHLTNERRLLGSHDQGRIGQMTHKPVVKQPAERRSNNQALKKISQEFKKEEESDSLSFEKSNPMPDALSNNEPQPVHVGTVFYGQRPESVACSQHPVETRRKLGKIAPVHQRLDMVSHGFGQWWVGPGLNDFDENLVQACRNRKRKFQQPDSVSDAKTYINNMLKNEDWGNFALRCEEAEELRERAAHRLATPVRKTQYGNKPRNRSPFVRSEKERHSCALGLARFKVSRGDIARAKAIAQQFGFKLADIGLMQGQIA
ncbi:MAG: hypothetical protein AAFR58_07510 [Cyanobacteria bacterium J06627_28]